MSTDSIELRKLTAQDLDQYNGLLRYAFQVTEKTLLESGWEDYLDRGGVCAVEWSEGVLF